LDTPDSNTQNKVRPRNLAINFKCFFTCEGSRGNAVSIVTRLQAGWMTRVRFVVGARKGLYLLATTSGPVLGPT